MREREAVLVRDRAGEAGAARTPGASPRRRCQSRPPTTRTTSPTSPPASAGESGCGRRSRRRSPSATAASSRACSRSTRRSPRSMRALRGHRRGREHLRDLHLRQRLHARRAPDPGREGAALRGGDPGAVRDPRPRDPRRARRSPIRLRNVDLAPTIMDLANDGPAARPRPADRRSLADPLRCFGVAAPDRAILIEAKRPVRTDSSGGGGRALVDRDPDRAATSTSSTTGRSRRAWTTARASRSAPGRSRTGSYTTSSSTPTSSRAATSTLPTRRQRPRSRRRSTSCAPASARAAPSTCRFRRRADELVSLKRGAAGTR